MAAGDVKVGITTTRAFNANVFDSVDDYVEIPHNDAQLGANLSNGFTISAWINPKSASPVGRIFDKSTTNVGGNGFRLFQRNTPTPALGFTINNGTQANSLDNGIIVNLWQHILVTISSAQLANFYKNGSLSGTANQDLVQTIATITTTNAPRIGNRSTATDAPFDGSIRDVKMWNRVLTSAEIAQDYAGAIISSGLIHHFKLGGDYADYGSIGVIATNSGSISQIVEGNVAVAIKAQRVTANDKFLMCRGAGGQIVHAAIEEAP
jgi:hypothetical protein